MQKALELLKKYVNLPSGTMDKADVEVLGDVLAGDLQALGMRVTLIPGKQFGPVVVGEYGNGDNMLLLMGHYDTVFPHGECQKFEMHGDWASGSGISDMKGGLVVMQRALSEVLPEIDPEKVTLTVLMNPDEEIGSVESGPVILEYARKAHTVLSFEPSRVGGGLVCERKGVTAFRMETTGIRGHAGAMYLTCASAIQELCARITRLYALRDDKREISVNIGEIGGGNAENVVADYAYARGEFRYYRQEYQAELMEKMLKIAAEPGIQGTACTLTFGAAHPALEARPENLALADRAIAFAGEMGRKIAVERTGGAGDIAIVGLAHTRVLDGLGLEGRDMHTTREVGLIRELPFSIALAKKLMRSVISDMTKP